MRVLTENFIQRLAAANAASRELRGQGYRVNSCEVVPGDALGPSRIEISGGRADVRINVPGIIVTRRFGSAA